MIVTTAPSPIPKTSPPSLRDRVLRAAWLAILLGLLMEALVVMALAGMGPVPKLAAAFADTVQKTSWSLIVCAGLAIGAAAARTGSLRAADRGGARLGPCLGYGFVAGIVFGGIALWLMQPMPTGTLVARAVNEMLFPVGCSAVLYASRLLERRIGGPA